METFWFFRNRFGRAYDSACDSDCLFSLGRKTPILTPTTSLVKTSLKWTKRYGGNTAAFLVSRTILDWAGLVKRTSKTNYHVEFCTNCLSLDDHFLSKELINLLYTFNIIRTVKQKTNNWFGGIEISNSKLNADSQKYISNNTSVFQFPFRNNRPSPKWRSKI